MPKSMLVFGDVDVSCTAQYAMHIFGTVNANHQKGGEVAEVIGGRISGVNRDILSSSSPTALLILSFGFIVQLLGEIHSKMPARAPYVVPALKKHTATVIMAHGLGDRFVDNPVHIVILTDDLFR